MARRILWRGARGQEGPLLARGKPVSRAEVVTAVVLAAAAVALLLFFSDLKTTGTAAFRDPGWDRHFYVEMVSEPFDFHIAPFSWRVLVPGLVSLSPFGMQASFLAIAAAAAAATGTVFYVTLRRVGFDSLYSAAGVLSWFAIGWGARFYLIDFWIPDAVAFFFVALCLWFAVDQRPLPFAIALLVGATAKESVLFAAPLYFTLGARRSLDLPLLARTVLVTIPGLIVVGALRLTIDAQNTDPAYVQSLPEHISRFPEILPEYDYRTLFRNVAIDQRYQERSFDVVLSYTTRPFTAALVVLAAVGAVTKPLLALRLAPFLLLVYSQLLFATDTERLLALGGFAVVWLSLEGLGWLAGRFALSPGYFLLLPIMLFAWLLADGERYATPTWFAAAALAATLAVSRLRPLRRMPRLNRFT